MSVLNPDGIELHGNLTAENIQHTLTLKSVGDESYYESVNGFPTTLLVHVHAWSSNMGECQYYPQFYNLTDTVWICPNFGGPNNYPEAAGHPAQLERIKRVIDATRALYTPIQKVILFGYSGGGYVTLMFTAAYPDYVDGFSAWFNIHDLDAWWNENTDQRASIEACLGGPPPGLEAQYLARSPKGVLGTVTGKRGYINSGAQDVQVLPHHQLDSYNLLAPNNDVTFVSHNIGHTFGDAQAQIAIQQINNLKN